MAASSAHGLRTLCGGADEFLKPVPYYFCDLVGACYDLAALTRPRNVTLADDPGLEILTVYPSPDQ